MDNKIILEKSNRKNKKYKVTLPDSKTVHFGDDRYEDYTMHKDIKRKDLYLQRHKKDPHSISTAGFWSRELLWSEPSMSKAIQHVEKLTGKKIKK